MRRIAIPTILRYIAVLGLLTSGSVLARGQSPDSDKIAELFTNMKAHAVLAQEDADLLDSYTRTSVSWRSHAMRINQMKEHANDLAHDFLEAKSLRDQGSPWQQEAIDQVEPLLQGMADHLRASIDHLSNNQNRVNLKAWQDYAKANYVYASKATNLIRDYVEYGEARTKVDAVEQKLEIPRMPGEE